MIWGRIASKPRQGAGGRHVSLTNSAVLSLGRKYCQVFQPHRKHHADTSGGQSLRFYELSPLSGKENLWNCFHPKVWKAGQEGPTVPKRRSPLIPLGIHAILRTPPPKLAPPSPVNQYVTSHFHPANHRSPQNKGLWLDALDSLGFPCLPLQLSPPLHLPSQPLVTLTFTALILLCPEPMPFNTTPP